MTDHLADITTALASRYAIERELGRGGMATVYLADDLKHHRKVAIKVLRPELAATLAADRFQREIEIAANLVHPHILPLLDSGTIEEQPSDSPTVRPSARPPVRPSDQDPSALLYYVMPYVEGESLREKLARERELPVADAVRILRDVVDALAMAHSREVIHRDIKPDNVMLSGRHALVADFGVAKALSQASTTSDLTKAGVALGRVDEVNALLDEVASLEQDPSEAAIVAGQELRAHGFVEASKEVFERAIEWLEALPAEETSEPGYRWRLARALYMAERWEEAQALWESVVSRAGVGWCAARMGDTATALEMNAQLAEIEPPGNLYALLLVRAELAALLGQHDEAMRLLRESFFEGMPYGLDLHRDIDLESLRDREDYRELVRPKG